MVYFLVKMLQLTFVGIIGTSMKKLLTGAGATHSIDGIVMQDYCASDNVDTVATFSTLT